jgi:hypothetical protein
MGSIDITILRLHKSFETNALRSRLVSVNDGKSLRFAPNLNKEARFSTRTRKQSAKRSIFLFLRLSIAYLSKIIYCANIACQRNFLRKNELWKKYSEFYHVFPDYRGANYNLSRKYLDALRLGTGVLRSFQIYRSDQE